MLNKKAEYIEELVQVAAVAVAAIQCIESGDTTIDNRMGGILENIELERGRQEREWGKQTHEPCVWMTILGEEFGEACEVALNMKFEKASYDVR